MEHDIIIKTYNSGQKNVALVNNEKYGICIRKTRSAKTSTMRMEREVNIQNTFDCSYYPKIYYSDVTSNNILIYEEYIDGKDLWDIFTKENIYRNNEESCLKLLKQLLIALNYIWKKSIIHRDLKHNNIKMRSNGTPVILDLGIAKILDSTDNLTTRMWFTEGYAPIEQFTNQIKLIDKRTDFFSLGVIIYELFFGFRLFQTNDEVIRRMPDFDIKGYTISDNFKKILSKLLEKRIYNRYRRVEDILEDVNDALGGKVYE